MLNNAHLMNVETLHDHITGSNAYLLTGEIATLLSGRYIEIKMLPLSFREYSDYIRYSSFPYTVKPDKDIYKIRLLIP